MKRKSIQFIISFVLSVIMFSGVKAYASNRVTIEKIKVEVDEKGVQNIPACTIDGIVYVKLVDIADALDYYLGYDKVRKEYVITKSDNVNLPHAKKDKNNNYGTSFDNVIVKELELVINYKELEKVSGFSIKGKVFMKLDEIAEAAKCDLRYDKVNKKYILQSRPIVDFVNENKEEKTEIETNGYETVSEMTKKGDVVATVDGDYDIVIGKTEKIGKEEPLPTWQEEWDNYPKVEFPSDTTALRAKGKVNGMTYDTIQKVNEYELERMVRTIYKYAKENSYLWENNDPSTNKPTFTIKIELTQDMVFHTFYPWRDEQIKSIVNGIIGELHIYAVDVYNNGKFMETQYFMK